MFTIEIKDIGAKGKHARWELSSEAIASLLGPGVLHDEQGPRGHAVVDFQLHRAGQAITVQGTITGEFAVSCSRCLGPAVIQLPREPLQMVFLPTESEQIVEEERALAAEDLDTYVHDCQVVDLEPLIREQLVLAIPIAPLCREDCLGICVHCGANQNETKCHCAEDPTHAEKQPQSPQWGEALRQIKERLAS
jgi:uncharacterized protein